MSSCKFHSSDFDFVAGTSFTVSTLSVHGDVQALQWTVMLAFQQFPVLDRLKPWWFLGSWPSEGLGLPADLGKVMTHLNNLSNCLNDDLGILSCLEMIQRDILTFVILLLRSSLKSLDFPIVLTIGQSSDCCKINPLYAGKLKLPVLANRDP